MRSDFNSLHSASRVQSSLGFLLLHSRSLALLAVCLIAIGCGESKDPRGNRVAVSGQVLIDGKPLSAATIIFVCDQGNGKLRAAGTVENGQFKIEQPEGPLPGPATVEVHPQIIELEAFEAARQGNTSQPGEARSVSIPKRYFIGSQLTEQISESEPNDAIQINLQSK